MLRQSLRTALMTSASAVLALAVSTGLASAASTTKTLSTNYTLVNLSSSTATVTVNYYKEDGSQWDADNANESFTIAGNGGQAIIRQYFDTVMASGRGSAVVASDQPLGAVVQIQARAPQVPTSGAYMASSSTHTTFYVPLLLRQRSTASGTGNSQIMVQNAGTSNVTVSIQLVGNPGFANFTKSGISIAPGATYYYDLADESSSNVPAGWEGSAVVTGSGQISVISNFFLGSHQLQTFNGFTPDDLTNKWFIPLFASNLANRLSTPVTAQNLSASAIATGALSMACQPASDSPNQTTFTLQNNRSIAVNESYVFNPVTDASIARTWIGSCVLTAPGNVAAFVQMRFPGANDNAAAFEAINGTGTDRTVIVPLVAKLLANGFATPVLIQNLGNASTNITLTYKPNASCSGCQQYTENFTLAANASVQRNFRLSSTLPSMPSRWEGTLTVVSSSQPIDGYVQLTWVGIASGDNYMAHRVFTQP